MNSNGISLVDPEFSRLYTLMSINGMYEILRAGRRLGWKGQACGFMEGHER